MDNKYIDQLCPVAKTLQLVNGKWKILILYRLSFQDIRYNELKRQVYGITNTVLTRALTELQQDGFIKRAEFDETPPRVIYSLTAYGKTFLPILHEIKKWSDTYIKD